MVQALCNLWESFLCTTKPCHATYKMEGWSLCGALSDGAFKSEIQRNWFWYKNIRKIWSKGKCSLWNHCAISHPLCCLWCTFPWAYTDPTDLWWVSVVTLQLHGQMFKVFVIMMSQQTFLIWVEKERCPGQRLRVTDGFVNLCHLLLMWTGSIIASCAALARTNTTIEGVWHLIMQKGGESYLILMSHVSVCYLWSCASRISEFKSWRQCAPLLPYAPYTQGSCIIALLWYYHPITALRKGKPIILDQE